MLSQWESSGLWRESTVPSYKYKIPIAAGSRLVRGGRLRVVRGAITGSV